MRYTARLTVAIIAAGLLLVGAATLRGQAAEGDTSAAPELVSAAAHERAAVWVREGEPPRFVFYAQGKLTAKLRQEGEGAAAKWLGEVVHETLEGKTHRYEFSFTAEKPDELLIGGKPYSIAHSLDESADPDAKGRGPWFVLTSFGRPVPSGRVFKSPEGDDLDHKTEYSLAWYMDRDLFEAETYRHNFELDDLEDWVIAWDEQHPISHSDGAREARVRIFADGRVVGARGHLEPLVRRRISEAAVAALVKDLVAMADAPTEAEDDVKVTPEALELVKSFPEWPLGRGLWDQHQDIVRIRHDDESHLLRVTHPGRRDLVGNVPAGWKEMNERLWKVLQEPMPAVSEARAEVEARLDEKIDLAVRGEPLIFLLDKLEKQSGVGVTLDLKRLREKGATAHAKITFACRQTPLREALEKILTSQGLDFEVTDSGVLIPAND